MNRIFIGIAVVLATSLSALAAKVTHVAETAIATTEADSLEALLNPGDTLVLKAKNGLSTLGGGIQFEKDLLTVILDCDSDRDGVGYISGSFKMKSTGASTSVRILFGKTHKNPYYNPAPGDYEGSAHPYLNVGADSYSQFNLGATGSVEQLYLVNNRADMDALGAVLRANKGPFVNSASFQTLRQGYALGQDIDMGTSAFSTMGNKDLAPFRGVFDGMGYSITGVKIAAATTEDIQGLFATTKFAVVRNLNLLQVNIQGRLYVGGIAGYSDSSSVFSGISVAGTVTGTTYVGGLVGIMGNSTVQNCTNKATIASATGYVGGLVGQLQDNSIVSNSLNQGAISSTSGNYVGGLLGFVGNSTSTLKNLQNNGAISYTGASANYSYLGGISGYTSSPIYNSANYGKLTNSGIYTGGITGISFSTISGSSNYGEVKGDAKYVGGLVGGFISSYTIEKSMNFGSILGVDSVGGIVGYTTGGSIQFVVNYGNVVNLSTKGVAGGLGGYSPGTVKSSLNYGTVTSSANAGGLFGNFGGTYANNYVVNLGSVKSKNYAGGFSSDNALGLQHALNTGSVVSQATSATNGEAYGMAKTCRTDFNHTLMSATITGPKTEAVCVAGSYSEPKYNIYNSDLAPSVGVTYPVTVTSLTHSTIRNFANYPDQAVFEANWTAPTQYSIPTPKNLFASGKVFKKLRQDVMALATVTPFTMEHPSTYLPTDGAEWKYSCFGRNSRVNCAVGATDMTISQAYNVTGDEVLVLQATHSTGFVVKDSLLLKLNVARKSEPVVGANWPATLVVEEGKALDLDLSQYFSDADGETMTYSVSATQVVVSEYANGHVTLLFNKLAGEETMTIQATDAGGRQSPVASVKLVVSTLPKVVTPLSDYVLDKGKIEVVDLSTRFFDADGDALTFMLTGAVNTESSVSGGNLTLVMNSDLGDVLVVSATDNDGHVVRDTLVLASTASPVLFLPSHSALAVSVSGSHLQVRSPMAGPATLEIWGSLGDLRWSTPLTLLQGLNETTLPRLQQGQYLVHLRTDAGERTLVWQSR